jgi:membrane-anchored protein YejM (alkaline phosphatase superfamily)
LLSLKKNVIIILIDGGRVDTAINSPIFQNLQSKFVFYPQSITYAPYTTGSMHAILSGCYGNRTGVNSYWNVYKFKNNQFHTLGDYLSENNYFTYADAHSEIIIPKLQFNEFNIHDEQEINLVESHSKLLEKMNTIYKNGKNFFLYLHFSKIHMGISNEVLKIFNNFSKEYFENKELNIERYAKLFNNAETYLNSIMNKIENLGFLENSIILILSDHGTSVGEKIGERAYGAFCYDYTLKTFAYLYNPDITPRTISSQVRHIDFMPTILEMLNIPINTSFEKLDGKSLMPLINGENMSEEFAFSETGNPLNEKEPPKIPNTKSIRNSKWKLIHNEHNNTKELYNLENDPSEENNLIGKFLEKEKELSKELLKYTNDQN